MELSLSAWRPCNLAVIYNLEYAASATEQQTFGRAFKDNGTQTRQFVGCGGLGQPVRVGWRPRGGGDGMVDVVCIPIGQISRGQLFHVISINIGRSILLISFNSLICCPE